MARRLFYVDEITGRSAYLRGETAQHLRKVLRAERGQKYEVSDGDSLWLAEIEDFGKDLVEFRLLEAIEAAVPSVRVHLYAALIKFDHFEWILEKATELGVERITPVYSSRVEKGLDQAALKRGERWRRILLESGQQARRLSPPALDEPVKLSAALAAESPLRLWLEEQRGAAPILEALPSPLLEAALLCGPEGGWDDRERAEAAAAGWTAVSLGPQVLRAETAALAALSILSAWAAKPA
ncbi:MAG: 16S rRNA (uracil(1498)-N(3))-methyltransferase [Acidobacteria bacterium]|nr:16S rRNA (uracil(1498)-N(3))-methyltransferase [Acidobacteriota bacterium]